MLVSLRRSRKSKSHSPRSKSRPWTRQIRHTSRLPKSWLIQPRPSLTTVSSHSCQLTWAQSWRATKKLWRWSLQNFTWCEKLRQFESSEYSIHSNEGSNEGALAPHRSGDGRGNCSKAGTGNRLKSSLSCLAELSVNAYMHKCVYIYIYRSMYSILGWVILQCLFNCKW